MNAVRWIGRPRYNLFDIGLVAFIGAQVAASNWWAVAAVAAVGFFISVILEEAGKP